MELKPCPFCGSNEVRLIQHENCWVRCDNCDGTGTHTYSEYTEPMRSEAIKAWNKRPQDNNEFGHSGDKTVSSYPEDNQQPPKERKVSLEEIEKIVLDEIVHLNKQVFSKTEEIKLHTATVLKDYISHSILSLLNATE